MLVTAARIFAVTSACVGEAIVLQQCGPPNGEEGESFPEGAALPLLLLMSAPAIVRCKIREGAGRRALRGAFGGGAGAGGPADRVTWDAVHEPS